MEAVVLRLVFVFVGIGVILTAFHRKDEALITSLEEVQVIRP
jgi:hypothetical protein